MAASEAEPDRGADAAPATPAASGEGDIRRVFDAALGTSRATLALAQAEARLAYQSLWSFGLWALAAFLLALTSWWLLCALLVAGAFALGIPLALSLALLLLFHLGAIFFIVRYIRELIGNIGFGETRAQLAAIAQAFGASAGATKPDPS